RRERVLEHGRQPPPFRPPQQDVPLDLAGEGDLHNVPKRYQARWPPAERRVHGHVQQHPGVVDPAELPTREQERFAAVEQLLWTDPEAERAEDERAMQVDLDAVLRV